MAVTQMLHPNGHLRASVGEWPLHITVTARNGYATAVSILKAPYGGFRSETATWMQKQKLFKKTIGASKALPVDTKKFQGGGDGRGYRNMRGIPKSQKKKGPLASNSAASCATPKAKQKKRAGCIYFFRPVQHPHSQFAFEFVFVLKLKNHYPHRKKNYDLKTAVRGS
jgi:hypothetical protein